MKYLILLMFSISICILPHTLIADQVDSAVYHTIQKSVKIEDNENILIFFYYPGSCVSCVDEIFNQLECIKEQEIKNLKIIIYVYGSREIEIKRYKKRYEHLGFVLLNSDDIANKLRLKQKTWIALIDSRTNILLSLDFKEAIKYGLCINLPPILINQ